MADSCWQGDEMTITPGVPKDVEGLRAYLVNMLMGKAQNGATTYPGPIATGYDPNRVGANQIMSDIMGGGKWGGANLISSGGITPAGVNTDAFVPGYNGGWHTGPKDPGEGTMPGGRALLPPGYGTKKKFDPFDPTTWNA